MGEKCMKIWYHVLSRLLKDTTQVLCNEKLEIACLDGEGTSPTGYCVLKGAINHLGTLQNGFYFAFVPDPSGNSWLHCDDWVVP